MAVVSLRVRQGRIDEARKFSDEANQILLDSGTIARFSWHGAYCAYRAGQAAMLQNRVTAAM
jgi:hypothetical protein